MDPTHPIVLAKRSRPLPIDCPEEYDAGKLSISYRLNKTLDATLDHIQILEEYIVCKGGVMY